MLSSLENQGVNCEGSELPLSGKGRTFFMRSTKTPSTAAHIRRAWPTSNETTKQAPAPANNTQNGLCSHNKASLTWPTPPQKEAAGRRSLVRHQHKLPQSRKKKKKSNATASGVTLFLSPTTPTTKASRGPAAEPPRHPPFLIPS